MMGRITKHSHRHPLKNQKFLSPNEYPGVANECKTHLCFEFISHAILSILYSYSCKTYNISSKLGLGRFLMKSK